MPEIKYTIPPDARLDRCRGKTCGQDIWWFKLPSGSWMCCDADGTPHWATCPDRKEFAKKKTKAATDGDNAEA